VLRLWLSRVSAPWPQRRLRCRAGETPSRSSETDIWWVRPRTGWTPGTSSSMTPFSATTARTDRSRSTERLWEESAGPDLRPRRAESGAGRPARARWILFHSWNGHRVRLGEAGLWRHRLGRVGHDARRQAAHESHGQQRVPRQLPRVLVARRTAHRVDLAQLESRRGRGRQVGRARGSLRAQGAREPEKRVAVASKGRKSHPGLHNLRYRASSSRGRRPDTSRSPSSGALPGT
jgi:hypothetical protein